MSFLGASGGRPRYVGIRGHMWESGDRPRYAGESAGVHNQVQHHLLTLERELLHRGNRYCHLSSEDRACIMLR